MILKLSIASMGGQQFLMLAALRCNETSDGPLFICAAKLYEQGRANEHLEAAVAVDADCARDRSDRGM
jgi:hypothetical protein